MVLDLRYCVGPYLNTICKIRELYRIYEYLRKKLRTSINTRTKRAPYTNPPTLPTGVPKLICGCCELNAAKKNCMRFVGWLCVVQGGHATYLHPAECSCGGVGQHAVVEAAMRCGMRACDCSPRNCFLLILSWTDHVLLNTEGRYYCTVVD